MSWKYKHFIEQTEKQVQKRDNNSIMAYEPSAAENRLWCALLKYSKRLLGLLGFFKHQAVRVPNFDLGFQKVNTLKKFSDR